MHPDRVTVRMYRRPEGLSTRPDDQTTLTCQSANTNDAPRDPLHGSVTWDPVRTQTYSKLRLRIALRLQSITITTITAPLRQDPTHCCIRYPTLAQSSALQVPCWQPFPTRFNSPVFYLIRLTRFSIGFESPDFDLTRITCFSV